MQDKYKVQVIKKVISKNITANKASVMLDCSTRTIGRYVKGFNVEGEKFFIHKNTGKTPHNKSSQELINNVVGFYNSNKLYKDFNIKHLFEKYNENSINKKYQCSYETFRVILKDNNIKSKFSHKHRKDKVHPPRTRRANFGEMVQMDAGGTKDWGDFKAKLHIAVDDATSVTVGAYFDKEETTYGYLKLTEQIVNDYGFPEMIYTDNRMVFTNNKENENMTHYQRIMTNEGVVVVTTSCPQAKGKVENKNKVFKDRLKNELKLNGIKTIADANKFLKNYIKKHNKQFAVKPRGNKNFFSKKPRKYNFNTKFSKEFCRKVHGNCLVHFNNDIFQIVKNNMPVNTKGSGRVLICLDNSVKFVCNEGICDLKFLQKKGKCKSKICVGW